MSQVSMPQDDEKVKWEDFLVWEGLTRDTIDFKKVYVDMAGDIVAGLLLSQIVFWYLPNKQGNSKLRVWRDSHYWIVKRRTDWYNEIRLSAKQVDRALGALKKRGLIVKKRWRSSIYQGKAVTHLRIIPDAFLKAWNLAAQKEKERLKQKQEEKDVMVTSRLGKSTFTHRGNGYHRSPSESNGDLGERDEVGATAEPLREKGEGNLSNNSTSPSTDDDMPLLEDDGPEPEDRDEVAGIIHEIAGKFGEYHKVNGSVTRARNIQDRAGIRDSTFVTKIQTAMMVTEDVMEKGGIKDSPVAYFFRVLENNLGLEPKNGG